MGAVPKLSYPFIAYFSSFFLLLLLHLLQCVANPPSRHACPSVRRFANSAVSLEATINENHMYTLTHIPIYTSFHHGTTSIWRQLYWSPVPVVWQEFFLVFAPPHFQCTIDLEAWSSRYDLVWLMQCSTLSYRKSFLLYLGSENMPI